jgi:alpha/beta superfamily hydrolase
MVNGEEDRVVPAESVKTLVEKLKTQKGIVVSHKTVPGANHFFEDKIDELMVTIDEYLDQRLDPARKLPAPGRRKG